jgi:hypothetical protein
MFHFKSQQSSDSELMPADLSQFSSLAVKALIQFIYTGTFDNMELLKSRLELFHLADYTTANDLCNVILQVMEKENVRVERFARVKRERPREFKRFNHMSFKCFNKQRLPLDPFFEIISRQVVPRFALKLCTFSPTDNNR